MKFQDFPGFPDPYLRLTKEMLWCTGKYTFFFFKLSQLPSPLSTVLVFLAWTNLSTAALLSKFQLSQNPVRKICPKQRTPPFLQGENILSRYNTKYLKQRTHFACLLKQACFFFLLHTLLTHRKNSGNTPRSNCILNKFDPFGDFQGLPSLLFK